MPTFADVVAFDPATITDHATFNKPQQYAGVKHVFVNGVQVLKNGEHIGVNGPARSWNGEWKVKALKSSTVEAVTLAR